MRENAAKRESDRGAKTFKFILKSSMTNMFDSRS